MRLRFGPPLRRDPRFVVLRLRRGHRPGTPVSRWLHSERFERTCRTDEVADETVAALGDPEFCVGGDVSARVGVTPGIEQRRVTVEDGRSVGVTEDDQIGAAFAPEQSKRHCTPLTAVGDRYPTAAVGEHRRCGQAFADGVVVGVAVDGDQSVGRPFEPRKRRLGREVAGVDDHLGTVDGCSDRAVESRAVGAVGIRQNDEHPLRWTRRRHRSFGSGESGRNDMIARDCVSTNDKF